MPGPLIEIALLDAGETARALAGVRALRDQWTPRHATYPFFTLGTASYLDVRDRGFAHYQTRAQQTNPLLAQHFGWIHDRIADVVAAHVGGHVRFDGRLALPGFHIFQFAPSFVPPVASAHFDLQYDLIDWTGIGVPDGDSQVSVTLTIALPSAGGGLWVWNLNRLELERLSAEDRAAHADANRTGTFVPYAAGRLVMHSGHQLHRIAGADQAQPGDERITMQAHALRVDGEWLIYW